MPEDTRDPTATDTWVELFRRQILALAEYRRPRPAQHTQRTCGCSVTRPSPDARRGGAASPRRQTCGRMRGPHRRRLALFSDDPVQIGPAQRRYHLSPAGRLALQAAARQHQPWLKSTGPRTDLGKATSSQNAVKHGLCSARMSEQRKAFLAHLRRLRRATKP